MDKSIVLAADLSGMAALLAAVLVSHPSRMLTSGLTRALPRALSEAKKCPWGAGTSTTIIDRLTHPRALSESEGAGG